MEKVVTSTRLNGEPLHLHQLVRHGSNGCADFYVVLEIRTVTVLLGDVRLSDQPVRVSLAEWTERCYEPVSASDGTPVWAY